LPQRCDRSRGAQQEQGFGVSHGGQPVERHTRRQPWRRANGYHNLGLMPNRLVSRTLSLPSNMRKTSFGMSNLAWYGNCSGDPHKNVSPATTSACRKPNARSPIRRQNERPIRRAAAGSTTGEGFGDIGKRQPDGSAVHREWTFRQGGPDPRRSGLASAGYRRAAAVSCRVRARGPSQATARGDIDTNPPSVAS